MKRVVAVAVVGLILLVGFGYWMQSRARQEAPPAAVSAPVEPIEPVAPEAGARLALLAELAALRAAFTAGDLEAGWQAAERLASGDLTLLSGPERSDYQDLRGRLQAAREKVARAGELLEQARRARQEGRELEALHLARSARVELAACAEHVPGFAWQESPLGRKLDGLLAALEPGESGEVFSATWEAGVQRALAQARLGDAEEALVRLRELLADAPPARRAWLENEIARLELKAEIVKAAEEAAATGLEEIHAHLERGQFHAGLRVLDQLENQATTGAQLEEFRQTRHLLMQSIQRRQTDLRKEAENLGRLLDLAGDEIEYRRESAAETLERAQAVLDGLTRVKSEQPDYEVPLEDAARRLERLRRALAEIPQGATP